MITFDFTVNKSFFAGNHPITVPKTQVDYDVINGRDIVSGLHIDKKTVVSMCRPDTLFFLSSFFVLCSFFVLS